MTDVFDQNTNTPPANKVATVDTSVLADKLKTIVNENGQPKYDDPIKALDALAHSQAHIKQLETEAQTRSTELETLRVRAAQADALEDVIERLKPNNPPASAPATPVIPSGQSKEATIEEQLEKILDRRQQVASAQENLNTVQAILIAKFGTPEKTKEAVASKAAELGMTSQDLGALSSKSPKAVLAYFGETLRTPPPVTPSTNTPLAPPTNDAPLERPKKSLLLGSTSKEQKEFMTKVKAEVYKRHNIEV